MKTYDLNTPQNDSVHEAAIAYLSSYKSPMDKVKFIRTGIPFSIFNQLREEVPFSDEEWAVLLDISLKSLQRYMKDGTHIFKVIHSERILEVVEVCELGLAVFENPDTFYQWCQLEMPALNHISPLNLIRDSYGKSLVMDELHAIAHGVFA